MTADSSDICVGSKVEFQLATGLGLPSAGDRQELIDANGIACLDGEEKIEGGSGRSITLGNDNLEEPQELDEKVDVALVVDREPIKVKGENGKLSTENGDDCDGAADATLNIDVSEANGCDDTAPSSDVEEGLVKLELPGTMAGEGIGDAIEQQLENEMLDEKKRDIKNGICEVKGERRNEDGHVKLSLENERSFVEDTNKLGAANPDLHVMGAEKQEGETLLADMNFEKLESITEGMESNALLATIDKHGNSEFSVYDGKNLEFKSMSIETQQEEESKTSVLDDDRQVDEIEVKLNSIYHDHGEETVDRAGESRDIVTFTDDNSQACKDACVVLLKTVLPQSVVTTAKEQELGVSESQVMETKEQEGSESATEVELVMGPQASMTVSANPDNLKSVGVQKEQKFEGLVTENPSCITLIDVTTPENSTLVEESVEKGDPIGESVIVEQCADLHRSKDCFISDTICVAEKEVLLSQGLSDSGDQLTRSRCQETHLSEQEGAISSEVDVRSPTDIKDKLSNVVAGNGTCMTETEDNVTVDDVDAFEFEVAIAKECVESSTSFVNLNEVERLLDNESKSIQGESGITENNPVLVKDPGGSTLDGEKPDAGLGKPQVCYIIRIPRFIDNQLSTNIQIAQSEMNEKTERRDSFKVSIEKQKVICNDFWKKFEDAKAETRVARAAVNAKRQQMESLQLMINKWKNVHSVEELDAKIQSMEFELQHVTIPLKEEKKYIHELKQLRHQRDQLTSNLNSSEEIDEAFESKEQIEEQFKLLKKELDSLRTELLQAEGNANAARKNYDVEQQVLKGLQQQFRDADALRQKAYGHWLALKNILTEKNKHFNLYKSDQISAERYLSSRDLRGLLSHCSKQVENAMAMWNNDEEFRMQYVKSNMNSTLRRLRTADGRSLGPDEEPPVMQTNQLRVTGSSPQQNKISEIVPPSLGKKVETSKEVDLFPAPQAATNKPSVKQKKSAKPILKEVKEIVITGVPDEEIAIDDKASVLTKEEEELKKKAEELAKKEEELRKEKTAAGLKELHRLEQIAKFKEAEERKRRLAEKAQARAEFRAQKEAEQREKNRSKKQKKKGLAVEKTISINGSEEHTAASIESTQTTQELNIRETLALQKPSMPVPALKQFNKVQPIPSSLRKKVKRKMMTTWMWAILTIILLVLFLAANYISFSGYTYQSP
ncbi:golgin subfamily B member 1-like [Zingiber officinale]|uniref:golgin subfamily B member 1-like n=1 Tax=Zingiber officinale TaxID=94328 RepID=UPI001C4D45AA|nr:golgin subfamily B member 1-like [Zingiber officinale]XP_042400637.1 golgin subfamily B member 1-like [Zingiber officinale]